MIEKVALVRKSNNKIYRITNGEFKESLDSNLDVVFDNDNTGTVKDVIKDNLVFNSDYILDTSITNIVVYSKDINLNIINTITIREV